MLPANPPGRSSLSSSAAGSSLRIRLSLTGRPGCGFRGEARLSEAEVAARFLEGGVEDRILDEDLGRGLDGGEHRTVEDGSLRSRFDDGAGVSCWGAGGAGAPRVSTVPPAREGVHGRGSRSCARLGLADPWLPSTVPPARMGTRGRGSRRRARLGLADRTSLLPSAVPPAREGIRGREARGCARLGLDDRTSLLPSAVPPARMGIRGRGSRGCARLGLADRTSLLPSAVPPARMGIRGRGSRGCVRLVR